MERRPIGYWLKHLDGLINASFERTFNTYGLARRHWQVLNGLTRGPATPFDLDERLAHFRAEGAITLDEVTAELLGRGWITVEGENLVITEVGREAHTTLARETGKTRELLAAGMSIEEYDTTVDNLARMAANLESGLASRS